MSKNQKLFTAVGLGVICGIFLRAAFSKSSSPDTPASLLLAQNNSGQQAEQAPASLAPPRAAPVTGGTTAAAVTDGTATAPGDGKEVVPDGKEVIPDGKEVVGKEVLPPVGETIGVAPQVVSIFNPGPPPEYLNKQLLSPPSPVNVSGPVVSPETR